jgi:hypothetical protein
MPPKIYSSKILLVEFIISICCPQSIPLEFLLRSRENKILPAAHVKKRVHRFDLHKSVNLLYYYTN